MNLKVSILAILLIVLAGFTFANAQAKSCHLDVSIVQYQENAGDTEIPVNDVSVTVTNDTDKKVTKSVLFEGMPRFAKLSEGKYKLAAVKVGYQQTVLDIEIDCAGLDNDGSLSETLFLWKGSSEEVVSLHKQQIGLTTINETPSVSTLSKLPATNSPATKSISGGVINGKARILVTPEYPEAARAARASGTVNVQVTINTDGSVVSAQAVSGHPLLRQAAEKAARASSFAATTLKGQPVEVVGIIVYNFVP